MTKGENILFIRFKDRKIISNQRNGVGELYRFETLKFGVIVYSEVALKGFWRA